MNIPYVCPWMDYFWIASTISLIFGTKNTILARRYYSDLEGFWLNSGGTTWLQNVAMSRCLLKIMSLKKFLKSPLIILKLTYTGHIVVVTNAFGKKTIPDLPCKDGWTFAFIVRNAFHYGWRGHSRLGTANGTRLDRASLVIPEKFSPLTFTFSVLKRNRSISKSRTGGMTVSVVWQF